jgi:hypothetical protein
MNVRAKEVSKWAIIFASVWVIVLILAKAAFPVLFDKTLDLSLQDILLSGVFFVVIWTPVYRSLWLDKKLTMNSGNRYDDFSGSKENWR